jgi:LmbE family N-acetylglucosaminyl deacetylase
METPRGKCGKRRNDHAQQGQTSVMMKLGLPSRKGSALRILCLGAHSDDIEIGCGGTILKLIKEHSRVDVYWVVFSAESVRAQEARKSARKFLTNVRQKEIVIKKFKDGFFPYIGGEIKEFFEELKYKFTPDIIFTHCRHDLHQDHRLINELTWNTFRDHFILEYEIIKYDGDIGNPNFFVHLDEETCRRKIKYILESFKSQDQRGWFTKDVFFSVLRLRGLESNSSHKFAEGFFSRKAIL